MAVLDLLARMLGTRAAYACCVPGAAPLGSLHPLEAATVARAVPRRRLELAAGRAAARAALAQLGVEAAVIPRAASGAPVWPMGVVGSIAHTERLAVAVAARASSLASLGVDLEPDAPLDEDLWPSITTPAELRRLREMAPRIASERARTLFCAKEATYKWQYPMTGLLLDFGDLEIQLIEGETPLNCPVKLEVEFEAIYQRGAPPFRRGDGVRGQVGRADGHVVAVSLAAVSTRSAR